jgi:hypothetical protein
VPGEVAQEAARGHARVRGQQVHRERLGQVVQCPGHCAGHAVVVDDVAHGQFDELRLAAVAVRRQHQPPGDRVGDLRAVVAAHQVQAQIQPGRAARAGDHLAGVDVEHVGGHLDQRMALAQQRGVLPVRGGRPAVQQARRGQRERAGADGDHPSAPVGGRAQGLDQRGGDLAADVGNPRNDHGVGGGQHVQAVPGGDREAADGRHRLRRLGADVEVVPGDVELGAGQAEHLHHAAQLEGRHPGVGQHRDPVPGAGLQCHRRTHGEILADSGVLATSGGPAGSTGWNQ